MRVEESEAAMLRSVHSEVGHPLLPVREARSSTSTSRVVCKTLARLWPPVVAFSEDELPPGSCAGKAPSPCHAINEKQPWDLRRFRTQISKSIDALKWAAPAGTRESAVKDWTGNA